MCWTPLCVLLAVCQLAQAGVLYYQPQPATNTPRHLHLAYGYLPSEMTITWSTLAAPDPKNAPAVWVGPPGKAPGSQPGRYSAKVTVQKFVDGGSKHSTQFIHRFTVDWLNASTQYSYAVGHCADTSAWSGCTWTRLHTFRARGPDGVASGYKPKFLVYGDFGLVNPQSLPRLLSEARQESFDAVLHVGDFAYDMDSNNAETGDKYMAMMEPLTANYSYMTCPGNHEHQYNFSNYRARFSMPGHAKTESMYYSFNMGPAHIISISTEYSFYFLESGFSQIGRQYRWLKADLEHAASPEQRAKHPWIIIMGHRPMYCSNNETDCTFGARTVRNGLPLFHFDAMEPLLAQYGVDLAIWAHEHSYERMFPVYKEKVMNGSAEFPYVNPGAPVHLVTGSAGCTERHDSFGKRNPYSAFRSEDYGYSRMHILNATHLQWQQVSDDKGGKIIDDVMIVQEKHGAFSHLI